MSYSRLIGWLLQNSFRGRSKKLLIAVFFNVLYLAGQGAAIFTIYWYGRQMQGDGLVALGPLEKLISLSQAEILWLVVLFSGTAFIASTIFMFISRRLVLEIVADQYARSLEALAFLTAHLPDPRAKIASRIFLNEGFGKISTGCRQGPMMTLVFVHAISSIAGAIAAGFLLLRLDLELTFFILLGVVSGALLLYPLALRAANFTREHERAQLAFRQERKEQDQSESLAVLRTPTVLARAFIGRRRVDAEFSLAIEIGITIILASVVCYVAHQALNGKEDWAIFIAYIAALRLVLTGCGQLLRAFGSLSRYYPQINRYYMVIKDSEKIDEMPLGSVTQGESVKLGSLEDGTDVIPKVGEFLALATTDTRCNLQTALLGATDFSSGLPLKTAFFRAGKRPAANATVVILEGNRLPEDIEGRAALESALKDKVVLVVHQDVANIGSCGERQLVTLKDGEFCQFLPLGTSESDAVLAEFARKPKSHRKENLFEDWEQEDE